MACMLASASAVAQGVDRSKAPQAGPAPKINIGQSQRFALKNGLQVIVVENHKLPRVSFQLSLDNDPIQEGEAAGYVSMAGDLMRKGSAKYTKDQINEAVDFIGASFSTSASGFYASSLTKHTDALLQVVSDVVLHPSFPAEELEKMKEEMLSNLAAAKVEPDAISENVAQALRYGQHPYGELVTEATVANITPELIKGYYERYFKPGNGYLIIVGDIDLKAAKKLAEQYFGAWKAGKAPMHQYDMPQPPAEARVALVDKPGAVQSVISITYPVALRPGDPDAIKASVMATLLGGGGFSGRLMQNIREDKGYTYGAYAQLSPDKVVGYFNASAKVRNAVTDSAVVEFLKEMNRIRDELPAEAEVARTKSVMAGSFARSLENPQTVARFALNIARYNLPADYYEQYLQRLSEVTPADVQAMAKKYILPAQSHILIVGNAAEVGEKLAAFGPVTKYDIYGKPAEELAMEGDAASMTAADVVAKHVAALGGSEKLQSVSNSYTVFGTTTPMGPLQMVLAAEAGRKAVVQRMNGQVMSRQLFFSDRALVISPMSGKQEMKGEAFEKMKHFAILYPELDYEANGFSLKMLDPVKIDERLAYQVEVTSPGGDKEIHAFDAESGLLVRVTSPMAGTQLFSDYQAIDGLMVPHTMTIETPMGNVVFKLEEIKLNQGLDASLFAE
jgi:predicted Zn-dependent peptidase